MFHSKLFSAWFIVLMLAAANAFGATNFISGEITSSATWSGTNLLTGTVIIRPSAVVNIEPGTRLLMNTAAVLRVEGQLLANGTSNQPITFTRSTTTTNWGRILFVRAAPSRLGFCIIEFANSIGDHQDYYYYDVPCNTNSLPRARTYREAVVALATHLDIEGCVFRNLPFVATTSLSTGTGDAIAIIADDRVFPGPASAHIWNCRFVSIGQAVHTRFSPVLVEYCLFGDKRGDNDDIDLYGESTPAPVIRFNTFLPGHEDKINPTRCSAIIYGNIVNGSDDHGIVLRDRGRPIVFNNLIINCSQAGISVQNQCDALIANNTIVNSARGVRLFDHFDRAGEPYCLFRGSGRATVINSVLWDCTNPFVLTDSTNGHSYTAVYHCNVEGGQAANSISGNSTFIWGPGNINLNPQFINTAQTNYRVSATSPCIDAGTNVSAIATTFALAVTNDFDGIARPLDGDGDGAARHDIGAYEVLLASADSNGDGIPDGWTQQFGFNPTDPAVALGNPDNDPHTTLQEWVADTDPTNALSYFRVETIRHLPPVVLQFLSSSNRQYTLFSSAEVTNATVFSAMPGQVDVVGNGGLQTLTDTNTAAGQFYRIGVKLR
jgi:parallel beta-helix repeat protein